MIRCVAFTGGGTGGHIYPGLAVAEQLKSICMENGVGGCRIVWIGSSVGMDRRIVEASGTADAFYGIPSGKLRRYFSLRNVLDLFKIIAGFVSAFFILRKTKPDVLFSKGGFVSVPPCFAARLLRIPVYTHECDFSPGLATRLNSKVASRILLSYSETGKYFGGVANEKVVVTGNPVRPVFYSASAARGREFLELPDKDSTGAGGSDVEMKPVLVVVGGSSGAHQINELVAQNISFLCKRFVVVHQTGQDNVPIDCADVDGTYKPYPFIYNEMPDVLAAADVVLSRAGANSIWECAVLGKPMVLVPLCGSGTRGDQVENARFFEERGAAIVLAGDDATSENLCSALDKMCDPSVRSEIAAAALSLASGEPPAQKIASLIFSEVLSR